MCMLYFLKYVCILNIAVYVMLSNDMLRYLVRTVNFMLSKEVAFVLIRAVYVTLPKDLMCVLLRTAYCYTAKGYAVCSYQN